MEPGYFNDALKLNQCIGSTNKNYDKQPKMVSSTTQKKRNNCDYNNPSKADTKCLKLNNVEDKRVNKNDFFLTTSNCLPSSSGTSTADNKMSFNVTNGNSTQMAIQDHDFTNNNNILNMLI